MTCVFLILCEDTGLLSAKHQSFAIAESLVDSIEMVFML